jgi:hypothetical protein
LRRIAALSVQTRRHESVLSYANYAFYGVLVGPGLGAETVGLVVVGEPAGGVRAAGACVEGPSGVSFAGAGGGVGEAEGVRVAK